jgi:hypothetical protein
VSPVRVDTSRDVFDGKGWWKCKVQSGCGLARIRTGCDLRGIEAPNPWLDPATARRLALALLAAAMEAEEG